MNKLLVGGAAAALVVAVAPSFAQPAPPTPPGVAQGTAPVAPVRPVPPRAPQVRMMVMSDKVMTRADLDRHIRTLFARFDSNHDGFITRDEIATARPGMMAMHGDMQKRLSERGIMMGDRGAIFDRLDSNHDGSISRQEFMASQPRMQRMIIMRGADGAAAPGTPGMPRMRMMHMRGMGMGGFGGHLFEMADANDDGRVSLQEAEAAALSHFDRADLNHDGRLTPEERSQAHQLMRQHRRS